MKPVDLKSKTYINFNKENNYEDSKFKVVDYVRTAKYKNIFAEGYVPNGSEEFEFLLLKVKDTVPWTYLIENLNGEKIIGTFTKKKLQKTSHKKIRIEKVIKRKVKKLYDKCKGYDNFLNSQIDKRNIVIGK